MPSLTLSAAEFVTRSRALLPSTPGGFSLTGEYAVTYTTAYEPSQVKVHIWKDSFSQDRDYQRFADDRYSTVWLAKWRQDPACFDKWRANSTHLNCAWTHSGLVQFDPLPPKAPGVTPRWLWPALGLVGVLGIAFAVTRK